MDENNHKVVVIQEHENAKKHFTWSDYCHQVNLFKFWILGISLIFAIIGYLVLSLYWNPRHEVSTSRIQLSLPVETTYAGDGTLQGITYLDGSHYSLYDIISQSNIEEVIEKNVDEEGKPIFDIDIDKLIKENGISIAYDTDSEGKATSPDSFSYVLTIHDEYIGNHDQVAQFVECLLENVLEKASSAIPSNPVMNRIPSDTRELEAYSLLSQMEAQYESIEEEYQSLLSTFGTSAEFQMDNTSWTLANYHNINFLMPYNSTTGAGTIFDSLSDELTANGYARYEEDNLEASLSSLMESGTGLTYRLNNFSRKITSVQETISGLAPMFEASKIPSADIQQYYLSLLQQMDELIEEQESLITQLTILGYQLENANGTYTVTLPSYEEIEESQYGAIQHLQALQAGRDESSWVEKNTAFFEKLTQLERSLSTDTNDINDIYRTLYQNRRSTIVYAYPGIVSTDGGINALIGAFLGLVLGFVLSSIILSSYGYIREGKRVVTATEGGVTPSEEKEEEKEETPSEEKKDEEETPAVKEEEGEETSEDKEEK